MQKLKAIETVYNGYRFRSRIEARWAVFFDALGIPWEYEKEGYDLGDGVLYLPDFWLPTVGSRRDPETGIWVEIKGKLPTREEDEKAELLTMATDRPVLIFVGVPRSDDERPPQDDSAYEWKPLRFLDEHGVERCEATCDMPLNFAQCHSERCRYVRVAWLGSDWECPKCGRKSDDMSPWLREARKAARQARFEHGEAPRQARVHSLEQDIPDHTGPLTERIRCLLRDSGAAMTVSEIAEALAISEMQAKVVLVRGNGKVFFMGAAMRGDRAVPVWRLTAFTEEEFEQLEANHPALKGRA